MDDLIAFVTARLDEDEAVARAASRDDERGEPADGEHWRWVDNGTDKVITPDPAAEFIDADGPVSLRSAEHYSSEFVGPLPHFGLAYVDEASGGCAAHIIRHDPARALLEVEAKRRIVEAHNVAEHYCPLPVVPGRHGQLWTPEEGPCWTLILLAAIWQDHPDYPRGPDAPGPLG